MGQASRAPIGGLGGVPGTAMYGLGGGMGGAATYGGGYLGNVGDSRTFSALSPRSQAYMQAGSPGSYASWLQGGGGAPQGGDGGFGSAPMSIQDALAMMFSPQPQSRPDYSQLFQSPSVQLEGPMMASQQPQAAATGQPTLTNRPQFYDTGGYF
jgi:hypothetical protein